MRALVFDGKKLEEKNIPMPRPARGEILVRVSLAGICSTDLEILRGYMDFRGVPGHEFVGTVVSGGGRRLKGKRVAGEINVPCGRCRLCRSGLGKHCRGRTVLGISGRNGAFAEYLLLPAGNLHPVPDSIGDEEAAFTELLAAACEIPERVAVGAESRIAVLGDGRLAAMAAQVLAAGPGKVSLFGLNEKKMTAIAGVGIKVLNVGGADPYLGYFDIVVEATGSGSGLKTAVSLARPRGTIVLKSTYHGRTCWNPTPIAVDEQTLIGSRCGPFDTALGMLESGRVEVLPFLTGVYPFDRWKSALRKARRRDSFKILLDFR